ncbi:MAG: Isoleucine--tRNA ligase [Mycoplasmataceae bacterium]|nr:MAG: Isoleucine--tRNA ligase [Mycoplasmataceae bacterium]
MNNKDKELKSTLLLPKTDFSLRNKEETRLRIIKFWEEGKIYQKSLDLNKDKNGKFIVHDGPPYSNGSIHLGHSVNRILKDIVLRFHNSLGFQTPFILGWDTHGLPIEFKVLNMKQKIDESEIRKECSKYALEQIDLQKNQLKNLGLFTDYDNYYSTQDKEYEATQIRVLADLSRKEIIHRGLRPIYWSWSHKTALAENEVEYLDREDNSTFFKLTLKEKAFGEENLKLLIWTTQPWTIPANMLVGVKTDTKYLLIDFLGENLILAESFFDKIKKWTNEELVVKNCFYGSELIGLHYENPYQDSSKSSFYIVDGSDLVSELEGTGILHIAPACGPDDFVLAKKENLTVFSILDENGKFTNEIIFPELIGMFYQKANKWIIDDLNKRGIIAKTDKFIHSFPHDWRDKSPLVYRLTEQWFINLVVIRNQILDNIEKVEWIPSHSKEKMISFINNRDDWCISRQRKWGVPIPSIRINGKSVIIPEIVDYVADLVEKEGSDFWFQSGAEEIIRSKFSNVLPNDFILEKDTLDVWFDSGVSHISVLEKSGNWPADLYLEGKDQFRGWFNSSLIISTIVKNLPPYRKVVSHGFTVDSNGKKMSKSLGNIIDPLQVINKFGIDTLRLWVSSVDFTKETKISEDILKGINDSYQKIRNTLRFIIGNLHSIDEIIKSEEDLKENLSDVDYYVLSNLWQIVLDSKDDYLDYKFNNVYNSLNSFCVNKLSTFYFEIIKDSLYCDKLDSNRRKQIVITLYFILQYLLKIISPILPFLAEEIYQVVNLEFSEFFNKESVHLLEYPSDPAFVLENSVKKIESDVEKYLISLRKEVFRCLENSRQNKIIEVNSQAKINISVSDENQFNYLKSLNDLNGLFLVSEVYLNKSDEFSIDIEKTQREKCSRCWKFEILEDLKCSRCINVLV